ncbi:hypothetical protein SAMN05444354_13169 [Stigmatella aurantiaca]|uniref:Uncharacterized protein n=1 Tax=Stigmatella aurantiaca TaxID=41 RepID=A0A1H8E0R8_STIAU|nr:hypothetical protein [Stigmatella aurantiaca]SEN13181.1 hypothetical protein SAMN05444354_13169 [Stigmatella aurantiaca]
MTLRATPASAPVLPPSNPPAKAVNTASSIPTGTVVQPLSVADYALAKKPEGVAGHGFEQKAALKQVGDPQKNGVGVGQAQVSGESFFEHAPGHLQAQAKGEAALTAVSGKFSHTHEGRLGTTELKAEFEVGARVKGEVGGTLSQPEAAVVGHAKAEGFAGARGEFSVEQKQGKHFSESLQGSVKAGAMATTVATFAFEPKQGTAMAKVGFSALAGAQESVSGELKLGVVRLSGGISAKQGVGTSFQVGAGIKDGRISLNANIGAAVGLGAGVNVGVTVNGKAIAHNAHVAGHAVKEGAHAVGHAVKEGAHTAGHAVKEAVHHHHHHRPGQGEPTQAATGNVRRVRW